MPGELANLVLEAVGPERAWAGVQFSSEFQAAGGEKVFPPSYPVEGRERDASPYLSEKRLVDGELREVVVLDQVPSQANRVESALLRARDAGRIRLPLFELTTATSAGEEVRITSLEFPHRYADSYLRDSHIDGTAFDKTEVGRRLRSTTPADVRPLFEWSPESLLFGAWDSHRKGRGAKLARVYSSSVVGFDPVEGSRKSGRMDPLNLTGAVEPGADGTWKFSPAGEKKKGAKLSEWGHGNIAPSTTHGGVVISGARRSGWLSLSGLANLRFGDAGEEACRLARATLAALAIAGDRLAFDFPSLWLRSGCDLVRTDQQIAFNEGGRVEAVEATAEQAIECFHELRERTAAAGIVMAEETVAVTPQPGLAQAIDYALTRSTATEKE